MLAELTHRCPLQCPYCSNPLDLERRNNELDTADWLRVLREAADLGCMQVHFSGGEPTIRSDLEMLIEGATKAGLYTNLITSAVLLDVERVARLVAAGLEHVQISFQDSNAPGADRIGHYRGGHEKKLQVAGWVRAAGLPFTANFVVHRQNGDNLEAMIDLGVAAGAHRIEIANTQYYGWALKNRAALMPSLAQLERMTEVVGAARVRLKGVTVIDFVTSDYFASRPKACMGGWGRQFLNVTPSGKVLPCHAAESIPGLRFDTVRDKSLSAIWHDSLSFNRFRGTAWMQEPCRSCERAEVDWGGCRCQALAISGDAARTDPACSLSADHAGMVETALAAAASGVLPYAYRRYGAAAR
jgi:pyrroloquinoline quinone biosynthesis protein E